jgi:hypothetical protein
MSLTVVVLGTFAPRVRAIFSDGVAAAEGASSMSMGVEAMIRVPARAGGSIDVQGRIHFKVRTKLDRNSAQANPNPTAGFLSISHRLYCVPVPACTVSRVR